MEKNRAKNRREIDEGDIERIQAELSRLDREMVDADGVQLKPSQCYHFEINPLHVLFNTNCPDELKQKIRNIISKHIDGI